MKPSACRYAAALVGAVAAGARAAPAGLCRTSRPLAWAEAARLIGDGGCCISPPLATPYQEVDVSLQVRRRRRWRRLHPLRRGDDGLCTPRALFRKLPPRAFSRRVVGCTAARTPVEVLAERLAANGYRRADMVARSRLRGARRRSTSFRPGSPSRCGSIFSAIRSSRCATSMPARSAPRSASSRRGCCRSGSSRPARAKPNAWLKPSSGWPATKRRPTPPNWASGCAARAAFRAGRTTSLLVREAENLEDHCGRAAGRWSWRRRARWPADPAHHGSARSDHAARREHHALRCRRMRRASGGEVGQRSRARVAIGDVLGGAVARDASISKARRPTSPGSCRFSRARVETARSRGERWCWWPRLEKANACASS